MSQLFNILPIVVIAFLPRSKRLLISWLQSLSMVILEPKQIKSATVSIVSPSVCHKMMGLVYTRHTTNYCLHPYETVYSPGFSLIAVSSNSRPVFVYFSS